MNWTCPYCLRAQTVTDAKFHYDFHGIPISGLSEGWLGIGVNGIGCANEDCKKLELTVVVVPGVRNSSGYIYRDKDETPVLFRRLMPESLARPQPDYIPAAIREDYREACLIRDLSPKASATLSRRCLQGMIRDFVGVVAKTLYQEISDLKGLLQAGKSPPGVSLESVDAIDHVRTIGNIGAHMEADVEKIIPVEPAEAQILIELIETLFDEWYIEQYKRKSRFAALGQLADSKKLAKATPTRALPPPEDG